MGVVYTVILYDEWDWGYVGKSRNKTIASFKKDFCSEFGYKPILLANWYEHIVFDIGKIHPDFDEIKEIIKKHSESCIYYADRNSYKKETLTP